MKKRIDNGFARVMDKLVAVSKEYKTTFVGLGCVCCIALYWLQKIDGEQFGGAVALLTSVGFFAAKDAD